MQSIIKRLLPRKFHSDDSNREPLPNISIVGLDCVGKTTLLHKLAFSEVLTISPTIGLFVETAKIQVPSQRSGRKKPRFSARSTDIGGCSKFARLEREMMNEDSVSGMAWVVDASDTDRLVESVEELRRNVRESAAKRPLMPVLMLVNKIDVLNRQSLETIRTQFDEILQGRPFAYFETCFTAPLPSSGLPEAFAWLGNAIDEAANKAQTSASPPEPVAKIPVEKMLADMRSPAALSAKLEDWLLRAEKDDLAEHLLERFYALDLPDWDHYTHIRLAFILLLKYGRRDGKNKIFDGFKDYIDKSGKVHGRSFHMTMTYFWVQMVHLGIASMGVDVDSHTLKAEGQGQDDLVNDFARVLMVNPYLVDGQLWADYYSKELLMSADAKEGVQFPDIKGLPDVLYPIERKVTMSTKDSISISSKTTLV